MLVLKKNMLYNFDETFKCLWKISMFTLYTCKYIYQMPYFQDMVTGTQCLKIIQNVTFEFFNFGIFHQFLTY